MSLPIFAPTMQFGEYLWDFAMNLSETVDEWETILPGSGETVKRFAAELYAAEGFIAECRLGLFMVGRWSYQQDGRITLHDTLS